MRARVPFLPAVGRRLGAASARLLRASSARSLLASSACLALACMAGGIGPASAAEIDLRGAYQLEGYYETNLSESVADQRLDINAAYSHFSSGIVFLAHSPSNPRFLDPNGYGAHIEGIRKRWVTVEHGALQARLGDSYATFGSGMVLRIIEDQTVDFDNVVDGGSAQYAWRGLTVEGISGTNSYGESRTMVNGLSGRYDLGGGWLAGLNGAMIDSLSGPTPEPGRDAIGGIQAAGSLPGGTSLTTEYAVRHYNPERAGVTSPGDGHAAYLAITGNRGPVTLLVEGKDFLRFRHAYAIPPTCVPQHSTALMNRASHSPNIRLDDERGFQTEATVSLGTRATLLANYSASMARHVSLPAREAYGQLETDALRSHWIFRIARTGERLIEGDHRILNDRLTYGGDWIGQRGAWSIETGLETQETIKENLARHLFERSRKTHDTIATITVGRSPRYIWSGTVEWTDDRFASKDMWIWVEWSIRMGVLGQVNLAGGSLRGGQVCSGGVCKTVAPFEGGRIELLANF
jgi:hypothetical protein